MVNTLDGLRDAFLMHKISANTMSNPLAMEAWEKANREPSKVRIWVYFCMSGLEDWGKTVVWSEING